MKQNHLSHAEALVRVVFPIPATAGRVYRYVAIIRFANCYSVVMSNDPTGYAGGDCNRYNVTQTMSLGRAATVANRIVSEAVAS